ncbi:MAG: hypothetical protein OHK0039_47870 [Bacteroidia bacterium]
MMNPLRYLLHRGLACGWLALCLLGQIHADAQVRPTGLIFDDAAYDAAPAMVVPGGGSKFGDVKMLVDLRSLAPIPGSQGSMGSCVGWAAGYAAMTIEYARLRDRSDRQTITREAFSPLYIYNQIKVGHCEYGSRIEDALNLLQTQGDVQRSDFDPPICDVLPTADLRARAAASRIEEYMTIFRLDAPPNEKIQRTKLLLANGKPVIVGMRIRNNFLNIAPGQTLWRPLEGDTAIAGGHAMAVVGYDEGRQAFLLFNSWGPDWGDGGCIWVAYRDYGIYCKYAYAIKAATPREVVQQVSLSGTFAFRYPDGAGKEIVQVGPQQIPFARAAVRYTGSHYETVQPTWYTGQLFQLVAMNTRADEYVYAFSIDAAGQANIHWPLRQGLDFSDFEGMNNAPLIPISGAELVIPAPDQAMQLQTPGIDHLCVLFSVRRIDDAGFSQIVRSVRDGQGAFADRLRQALGDKLIPPGSIRYLPDEMAFTASSNSGYIVPLILQVKAE